MNQYRRYGATAVKTALLLTDLEITGGRRLLSGSPDEQRAAAVLHTETLLAAAGERQSASLVRHLRASTSLLDDLVNEEAPQIDFAYRWYTITERLLDTLPRGAPLKRELQHWASGRFPQDFIRIRRTYESGRLFELQGCLWHSGFSPRWRAAARLFEEVLRSDPGVLGAALHLGRIRMLEGNLAAAAQYFERATAATDPHVAYLARIFLGSLDERVGRPTEAEYRYRQAIQHYPWGQSAHLALAQILSRTGREPEARLLLADRFSKGHERTIEPLWTYLSQPGDALVERFDELRAEVWR